MSDRDRQRTAASDPDERDGVTRRSLLKTGAAGAVVAGLGGAAASSSASGAAQSDAAADAEGGTETAYGNCWMCHKLCGMEVTLNEDGRAEELHGIDGHPRGSAGEGREGTLCPKGLSQLEKAYSPRRIKKPHVRRDGDLQAVSWDEAIEFAADRLSEFATEHGPEKLLQMPGWGASIRHSTAPDPFGRLFGNCYGSPQVIYHPVPTCFGSMAVTGTLMGLGGGNIRFPDYPNTEYVLVWGRDPLETFNGQWEAKQFLDAKERGATVVTIDPTLSETAKKSDRWLPIEPRTDGALALAMANVIIEENLYDAGFVENYTYGFEAYEAAVEGKTPEWAAEKTGLDADEIREVAIGFAEAAPRAAITSWTGLGQSPDLQKAAQNVVALLGLVGAIDRPGGQKWFGSASLADPVEVRDIDLPNNAKGKEAPLLTKKYPPMMPKPAQNQVPNAVTNGDVRGMVYYYRNPVTDGAANEWLAAIDEMDLVIGIDAFWSETTRNADVVLPESTQLEKPMLGHGGSGAYPTRGWVTGSTAAIEPQFDTKPGFEIIRDLAHALGYGEYFPWADKAEWLNDKLSALDMTLEDLEARDTYVLHGEYGYEKWKEGGFANGSDRFWFDLDKKFETLYGGLSEKTGFEFDTGPQWVPPGTLGDELTEEYPLEMIDTRTAQFSHGGDQALSAPLEQLAESFNLEHEDYRGNYLVINPEDAGPRGIETGDMVQITSPAGEGELMAAVSEGIVPGTVEVTPYGFGRGSVQPDEEGANNMFLNSAEQIDPVTGQIDRHIAIEVAPAGGEGR